MIRRITNGSSPRQAPTTTIYTSTTMATHARLRLPTTVPRGICTATLAVPTTGPMRLTLPSPIMLRRGATKERSRSQKSVEQKTATCVSVSTTALIRGDRRCHRMLSTAKARSRTPQQLTAQAITSPSPRTLSLPRLRQSRQRVGGY